MDTTNFRTFPAGETCDVDVGDGINIQLFRSVKFVGDREGLNGFRPAKILKNGTEVWTYQKSGAPAGSFGELCEYGVRHIIVLRDRHNLYDVVIPSDYAHMAMMKVGDKMMSIGGTSFEELLDIKLSASSELCLDYRPSQEEVLIINVRQAKARQLRAEDRVAADGEAEVARRTREERIYAVTSRKKIEAWSAEGKRYFGLPIEGDEWMVLSDGTYCILSEGDVPKSAFIVKKKGAKVSKINETEVFPSPEAAQTEMPEAVKLVTIKKGDESRRVPVFRDFEAVKALRTQGLNSGTWIAVQPAEGHCLTVYAVHRETIETVGKFQSRYPSGLESAQY